jgi:CubicO group peptidase (beta-lactamase class C family)
MELCRYVALSVLLASQVTAASRGANGLYDDLLSKWDIGSRPGIAVIVIQSGRVRYQRTLGYADVENKVAVRSDTPFLVGSISKQFTAGAVLLLAREGKLRLDDAASRFVPDLPEYARAITIRQFMHHTGGLPDHEELLVGKIDRQFFLSSAGARGAPFSPADAFTALRGAAGLRSKPGEKWEYSNTGYFVLGQVIERVCHCSYAEFLTRRLFEPLGMKHSRVIPVPPANVPGMASAYTRWNHKWVNISYSPLNFMVGHDGVVSTLQDMTRWAREMANGMLFTPAEHSAIFETGHTNDGAATQYGFGWRIAEVEKLRVFQHEGCWSGFRNGIVLSADRVFSAIVLTNANDVDEFWNCEESMNLARELVRRASNGKY